MGTEPRQIELQPAIGKIATTTNTKPILFEPFRVIGVGFGLAALTKDGAIVWAEDTRVVQFDDDVLTGADAEKIASGDPDHDWRIVIDGPVAKQVYQRHGIGRWVLIERGDGFA